MKLSKVFLNALVATSSVSSLAVSSSPSLALVSHDTSSPPLIQEATTALRHFSRKANPNPAAMHAIISIRAAKKDEGDDEDYPSAQAEAQALGLQGGFRAVPTTASQRRSFNIAHGTLMGLTFTLWFPLGAVVMHTTRNVRLHAALQAFAYANAVAGLGLGVWLGRNVRYLDYAHTVIGMAVVVALVLQVALGVWAHWRVVAVAAAAAAAQGEKEKDAPRASGDMSPAVGAARSLRASLLTWAALHRWLGRSLLALGIINGGLGLKLAQNTKGGMIAYGLVAGLVAVAYLSLLLSTTWKRHRSMVAEKSAAPRGGMLT